MLTRTIILTADVPPHPSSATIGIHNSTTSSWYVKNVRKHYSNLTITGTLSVSPSLSSPHLHLLAFTTLFNVTTYSQNQQRIQFWVQSLCRLALLTSFPFSLSLFSLSEVTQPPDPTGSKVNTKSATLRLEEQQWQFRLVHKCTQLSVHNTTWKYSKCRCKLHFN